MRIFTEEHKKNLSEACKGRIPWNKGLTKKDPRVRRYLKGSKKTQFRAGPRPETKGEGNANWKGGRTIQNGPKGLKYIMVRVPDHPYAVRGYVMEHRIIMEKKLGRYLLPTEIIHHKNGNNKDNRLENLEVMTRGEHIQLHVYGIKPKRRNKNGCEEC